MDRSKLSHYRRFAVLGLGCSGIAAANLLARRGKKVIASDSGKNLDGEKIAKSLDSSVDLRLGKNVVDGVECIVVSPGLKPSLEIFQQIPLGVEVIPEVELARAASQHRWLGITGTDGKTTTTELTTHILTKVGVGAVAAGNIGIPLCDVVDKEPTDTVIVAELSGFQMWSARDLHLEALAVTNIAPDHLDYFNGDLEAYIASKLRLFEEKGRVTRGVFNIDDQILRSRLPQISKNLDSLVMFGSALNENEDLVPDLRYSSDTNSITFPQGVTLDYGKTQLIGRHNAYNTMAAAALAHFVGIEYQEMIPGITSFTTGPHRIEFIGEFNGVSWINDSKATNPHSSQAGLLSIETPLVAIVGGVDKKLDLNNYIEFLSRRCKGVVLIGELRNRITKPLKEVMRGENEVQIAENLDDAIEKAAKIAAPGDAVILSPACSSFDMFKSYQDRGETFRAGVKKYYTG